VEQQNHIQSKCQAIIQNQKDVIHRDTQ